MTHKCDRQTDRQTDKQTDFAIASAARCVTRPELNLLNNKK